MSLVPHTCRHLVQQRLGCNSSYIWVSDELLSNVFHRFTISKKCLRHGSSLPGPLEAKRRLTKRRMMNLASRGVDASIDGAAILGMHEPWSQKNLEWEPPWQLLQLPKQAQGEEVSTPWPSWLDNHSSQTASLTGVEVLDESTQCVEQPTMAITQKITSMTLEDELRQSKGLDGIRKTALHHGCVLSETKGHSKLAFQTLLSENPSLSLCMEFLEDPSLNAPEAQNLYTLMEWETLQAQPARELEVLGLWVQTQVMDGQFSQRDILSVLKGVKVQNRVEPVLSSRKLAWSFCMRVWTGIQASTVNATSNLYIKTIRELLEAASHCPSVSQGRALGCSLLMSTQHAKLREITPSILVLVDRLSTIDNCRNMERTISFDWFSHVLRTFSESEASTIATTISRRFAQRACKNSEKFGAHLESWFSALPRHVFQAARNSIECIEEWSSIERDIVSLKLKVLASYLRLRQDQDIFTFILRRWLLRPFAPTTTAWRSESLRVRRNNGNMDSHSRWTGFVQEIEQLTCYSGEGGTTSSYLELARKLLETSPSFFRAAIPSLLHLLRCIHRHDAVRCIAHFISSKPRCLPPTVLAFEITLFARTDLPFALALFHADPRLRLEDCPSLATRLIASPLVPPNEIFTLLSRSGDLLGSAPSTTHPSTPYKVHTDRLALLHEIALAFAHAPHLAPRKAYRKVRRVLDLFRDRPDLLRPEMAQALTKAGVLRYLEAGMWVNTVRLNYVLGYVKHLEGEEVVREVERGVWAWRGRNTQVEEGRDHEEEEREEEREGEGEE
ncbi:hypothetical protein MMC13_002788 [Lambiella insularis]|nr:hypothetical protein [Lambiella insularis]